MIKMPVATIRETTSPIMDFSDETGTIASMP